MVPLPPLRVISKLWSETFSGEIVVRGHFNHFRKSLPSANLWKTSASSSEVTPVEAVRLCRKSSVCSTGLWKMNQSQMMRCFVLFFVFFVEFLGRS